jgi:hypothetical protein
MHRSTTTIVLSTLVLAVPAMAWTPNPERFPDGGDWIPELHGGEIPWVPEDGLPELPDGGLQELPEFGEEVLEFPGDWELPELWAPCRIDVPEDYATIQAAVDAADNGCLIVLAEGTYVENVIIDEKALRIIGDGDVTVRPDADESVFIVLDTPEGQTMQFDGITLSSVLTLAFPPHFSPLVIKKQNGHGIVAVHSALRLTDMHFENLSVGQLAEDGASVLGSGVFLILSNTEIERCDFDGCESDEGGAVVALGGVVSIDQSHFYDCDSMGYGGAVVTVGSTLNLNQCSFLDNDAYSGGGHIAISGGDIGINRCAFDGGDASSGGAAYSAGVVDISITACQFRSNSAGEYADAWYHDTSVGLGPYLFGSKFCNGSTTVGTIEGIVPIDATEVCSYCPGDVDMDAVISVSDLIDMLSVWDSRDPFADLDGDDTVDLNDLMSLLADFGGCGALPPL